MGLLLLLLVPLASMGIVNCNPESTDAVFIGDNLFGTLTLAGKYKNSYFTKRAYIENLYNNIANTIKISDFKGIGSDITEVIEWAAGLRELLVEGHTEEAEIPENNVEIYGLLGVYILVLSDCTVELRDNITKWLAKKDGEGAITKVTDAEPLEWFKLHGFTEETLKDVTIEDLEVKLGEILKGSGDPLKRAAEFFATTTNYEESPQLGVNLAWLVTFAESETSMRYLETFVKEHYTGMGPEKVKTLLDTMRGLGGENGSLRNLIGKSMTDGFSTWYLQVLKYLIMVEKHAPFYMRKIIMICRDLEEKLTRASTQIRGGFDASSMEFFTIELITINKEGLKKNNIEEKLKTLIGPEGDVHKLCKIVSEFEEADPTLVTKYAMHIVGSENLRSGTSPLGIIGILLLGLTFIC